MEKFLILENTLATMLNLIKIIAFVFVANTSLAQWQWTELDTMPFRTSNNAVCEAIVGGDEYVYSFGGIDPSKIYSGIHQKSFKYTVATDTWEEIDSLPDVSAKIAAAASFVKNKIYIIGGYHVLSNSNEISSNKVHVYNPDSDLFEADGTPVPLAIDDQVQCVYKDSLIFVVTGWSDTENKPNVQIYDPSFNSWQVGTPTPNTGLFTAFGASGYIIGDTLYYYGGAAGNSFSARQQMRRGFINPADPTDITWTQMADVVGAPSYRAACSGNGNSIFWVGGSPTSYNFNGIAYNGTGGVSPSTRVLNFNVNTHSYIDEVTQPHGVMDLRGIAKLSNNRWIICGGMSYNQQVSNRTFIIENQNLSLFENDNHDMIVKSFDDRVEIESLETSDARLIDLTGQVLQEWTDEKKYTIDRNKYNAGVYILIKDRQSVRIKL